MQSVIKEHNKHNKHSMSDIVIFSIYYIGVLIFDLSSEYYILSLAIFGSLALYSLVRVFSQSGKIIIAPLHRKLLIVIMLFTLSSLVGISIPNSFIRIRTVVLNTILSVIVFNLLYKSINEEAIEKILRYSGIVYVIWTLYIYGPTQFFSMLTSGTVRLGGEISQENVFGMAAGTFATAYIFYVVTKKKYGYLPLIAAMMLLISASASRKAILVLPIALATALVLKNGFRKWYRTFFVITLLVPAIINLMQSNVFGMASERLLSMLSFFTGGETDLSTQIRNEMLVKGMEWFWERPILGYGLDCYKYLAVNVFGSYSYAHNCYVELLVDTGLIGFIAYYSIYAYLLYHLIKQRKCNSGCDFYIMLMVIMLFNDIGSVTYLYKTTYIYWTLTTIYIVRQRASMTNQAVR